MDVSLNMSLRRCSCDQEHNTVGDGNKRGLLVFKDSTTVTKSTDFSHMHVHILFGANILFNQIHSMCIYEYIDETAFSLSDMAMRKMPIERSKGLVSGTP